jgi:S1-C subfamily serine protease
MFKNNIVFAPYRDIRVNYWGEEIDYNLLHIPKGDMAPATVLQSISKQDEHSLQGDARFINPELGNYQIEPESPVISLGFKNFSMDQFGVVSPNLKKTARTPTLLTILITDVLDTDKAVEQQLWLGATIKNLVTQEELSATGMGSKTGVYFIRLPEDAVAGQFGFKEGDVLLTLDGKSVKNVKQFLNIINNLPDGKTVTGIVHRNQRTVNIQFKI